MTYLSKKSFIYSEMNFVALIGIVEEIKIEHTVSIVSIKVEKNLNENEKNEWYDLVLVELNNNDFASELNKINKNDIVGVKGRLSNNKVIVERFQIF
ncbi:MAG: hypothetical protein Ta2E_07920 [Mycoplasmoidaceae bacterium]|nr:MAG: hypothetical protein Ta2E_07920 [Mycoplasmoidaceae bacterium]